MEDLPGASTELMMYFREAADVLRDICLCLSHTPLLAKYVPTQFKY